MSGLHRPLSGSYHISLAGAAFPETQCGHEHGSQGQHAVKVTFRILKTQLIFEKTPYMYVVEKEGGNQT